MQEYWVGIWQSRYFWLSLVQMDLRQRYRGSVLGLGWSLVHPILLTTVLCIVFCTVLGEKVGDFAPYLLAGLATWNFVVQSIIAGCRSFFIGEHYIRQQPVPLAVYPLRVVLGSLFHFVVAIALALVVAIGFRGSGPLTGLIYLLPALAVLFAFTWSLAILGAFANVYFRDTVHLAEVSFQILFYATPIIYSRSRLPPGSLLGWILQLNPLVPFLDLVRVPLMEGHPASAGAYLVACLITLLMGGAAFAVVGRLERRLIFHL